VGWLWVLLFLGRERKNIESDESGKIDMECPGTSERYPNRMKLKIYFYYLKLAITLYIIYWLFGTIVSNPNAAPIPHHNNIKVPTMPDIYAPIPS